MADVGLGVSQPQAEHGSGKSACDQVRRIPMLLGAEIFIRRRTMRALLTRDGLHQFPGAGRDVGEQRGTESMRGLSCSLHEESWHALAIEHGAVIPSDGEFFTAVTISVNPRKTARSEARGAHHHVKVFCHHVSGYSVANVHVDAAVGTITRTEHLRGPANIEPLTPGALSRY